MNAESFERRNFETWDHGGLSVPLNEKGQKEYENWIEDTPDIYWDILYSEDYYALEHVFWEWNDEFDLLIDMYEDEEIRCEIAPKALALVYRVVLDSKDSSLANVKLVASIVNCNYLRAKRIIENAPSEIFSGKAVDVREIRDRLVQAGMAFRIEPDFPY